MEEFLLFPFFVIIGLIAGILGSMIGVGGGIIISPALTFLGLTPPQVAGTSLFAVSSTSISSTIAYARSKKIQYMLGIKMALLSIPGAIVGSYFSTYIDPGYFKILLAMILVATGIYLMYRKSIINGNSLSLESIWVKILFLFRYICCWNYLKFIWNWRRGHICSLNDSDCWIDDVFGCANLAIRFDDYIVGRFDNPHYTRKSSISSCGTLINRCICRSSNRIKIINEIK